MHRATKMAALPAFTTAKNALETSLILDVREPAEYAAGHLPGAFNIPRGVLEFKIGSHPDFQDKQDAHIIVYCQTGGRSALATEALNIKQDGI